MSFDLVFDNRSTVAVGILVTLNVIRKTLRAAQLKNVELNDVTKPAKIVIPKVN